MKKGLLLVLLLVFLSQFCVFADTGTIQYKYVLNKHVDENIELSFANLNNNAITTYAVDSKKTLSSPQVQLAVSTNKVNSYKLKLTFSVMTSSDSYGFYKARVFDMIDAEYMDISFESVSNVSITFTGDTSHDGNTTITAYYPIAFDFTDYISDYGAGNYSATIKVEVSNT